MNDPAQVIVPFGKFKGRTLGWIAENDILYLDWLIGQELYGELETAVEQMCETWADEIEEAMGDK